MPHNILCFRAPTKTVSGESSDPTVIRSIAVSADDLVSALETNWTSSKEAVLRVTPPFSGRMRARLHVDLGTPYSQQPQPIHIQPRTLVDETLPDYPEPAETEDELRTDPSTTYTVERHRRRHEAAVEAWRQQVPDAVRDRTTIETAAGHHEISIAVLGTASD
jgi:hypothetical protein